MRTGLAAIAIAAAVALAGCGSGDDKGTDAVKTTATSAPGALSRAQFIAKADAICTAANAASKPFQAEQQALTGDDYAGLARVLREQLKSANRYRLQIKSLVPPAQISASVAKWMTYNDQLAAVVQRLQTAADKEDGAELRRLSAMTAPILKNRTAVTALIGLHVCGQLPAG